MNAKDFALIKTSEIMQLCDDLINIHNKELKIFCIEKIHKLAQGIEEHLEYLDIKEIIDDYSGTSETSNK